MSPLPALSGQGSLALSEQDSILPKHYIYSGKFLRDGQKNSLALTSLLSQSINKESQIQHEKAVRLSLGTSTMQHLPAVQTRPKNLSLLTLNAKPSLRPVKPGKNLPGKSSPENIYLSQEASESIASSMAHSYDISAEYEDSQYLLATAIRQRQKRHQWNISSFEDCDSEALIQSIHCPLPAPRSTFHTTKIKTIDLNLPPLL